MVEAIASDVETSPPETAATSNALTTLILVAGFCVMGGSVILRKADIASGSIVSARSQPASDNISTTMDNEGLPALDQLIRAHSFARETEMLSELLAGANHPRQISLADIRSNPFRTSGSDASASQSHPGDERRELLQAAQRLQLCAIDFNDARRTCTINNTLYREGQTVDSFTVEKINPGSVVVKCGMYRFELK